MVAYGNIPHNDNLNFRSLSRGWRRLNHYFCRFCAKTISDLNCILLMPKLATGVMSTCLQGLCRLACCKPGLGNCMVPILRNGLCRLMWRYTTPQNNLPNRAGCFEVWLSIWLDERRKGRKKEKEEKRPHVCRPFRSFHYSILSSDNYCVRFFLNIDVLPNL